MSAAILAALRTIDGALAKAGAPAMSAFWRGECERFYSAEGAHLMVECVGRGGDKSRTSVKMAIAETLAGDFIIAPGERHYFTHVAENKDEAAKTLRILEQYLRILRIGFRAKDDTIELDAYPRGFKVLAARVGAVSGWRSFGWTADESAKWSNEGSDPSAEVIASIKAMTVTHPNARGRMISSPLAASGYFYDVWSEGDTDEQIAGTAPTWIANPSITEARTHKLEPHDPTWRREYSAIPSSGVSIALPADDLAAMVREVLSTYELGAPIMVIDSSAGRGDGWSFAIARFVTDRGRPCLYVTDIGAFEGKFAKTFSFDDVTSHLSELAHEKRVRRVFGDQFQSFALASAFGGRGLVYEERAWTQGAKIEAVAVLRRMLRERTIALEPGPEAEKLKAECLLLEEKILPSGSLTVGARRSGIGHADRASLLMLLARLEAEGALVGSAYVPKPRWLGPTRTRFGGGIDMHAEATPMRLARPTAADYPPDCLSTEGRNPAIQFSRDHQSPVRRGWGAGW